MSYAGAAASAADASGLGAAGIAGLAGSAIGSFAGAFGDFSEATGYNEAAKYATQQAQYVKLSTGIQEQQTQRQMYQVLGATEANAGANSMALSGSAADVFRSNVQQATMQKSLVALQGGITEAGYNAQASADKAMASATTAGGIGGILGGLASVAAIALA